jgi:hypothetical protein
MHGGSLVLQLRLTKWLADLNTGDAAVTAHTKGKWEFDVCALEVPFGMHLICKAESRLIPYGLVALCQWNSRHLAQRRRGCIAFRE